ncbi:MAG: hypothetical protein WCG22_07840 [Lentisphaerota bacterium]
MFWNSVKTAAMVAVSVGAIGVGGAAAVQAVEDGKWGHMVALQSPDIVTVPIAQVLGHPKRVDPNHDIVRTARRLGISFGDQG